MKTSNESLPGGVTGRGFRPGQSGNPRGKRKGCVSLAAALARSLTREDAEEICRKLILLCKSGNMPALKLLFDRYDGPLNKVPSANATAGEAKGPMVVKIMWPHEMEAQKGSGGGNGSGPEPKPG